MFLKTRDLGAPPLRGGRAIRSNSSAPLRGPPVFPLLSLARSGCPLHLRQNPKFSPVRGILRTALFIAASIVFLCLSGCNNGTTDVPLGTSVVCLGDSLTAGYGASSPEVDDRAKSYPAYLQEKINIPVVNAGITGDTTSQALARTAADVLTQDPRVVIIELGANDLFTLARPAITKRNLQEIIHLVDNGNRKIYIAKFYTEAVARAMAGEINIPPTMISMLINQYDALFNDLAAANNVELIEDIWDGVWGIHMSDALHPDAEGYKIMADNYFKIMEPYLQENNLLKLPAAGR